MSYKILKNSNGLNILIIRNNIVSNVPTKLYMTPLMKSVLFSNYKVAQVLTKLGANPLIKNQFGIDCFILCKWMNDFRILKLIEDSGNGNYGFNKTHENYVEECIKRLKDASNDFRTVQILTFFVPNHKSTNRQNWSTTTIILYLHGRT